MKVFSCRGRQIALDIALGVCYLHSKGIIHFDLKGANVLLSKNLSAKISDVGLSKIMRGAATTATQAGTWRWASPEQISLERGVTLASDIWSLAVLVFDLCSNQGVRMKGREVRRLSVPAEAPQAVQDLIDACLVIDSAQRPSATEFYSRLLAA